MRIPLCHKGTREKNHNFGLCSTSMQRESSISRPNHSSSHGNQTETALGKERCTGPGQRRDSRSRIFSHFRLNGFVICFKIRKPISLYNSTYSWDFFSPPKISRQYLIFTEFDIFWISVDLRYELPFSNPNVTCQFQYFNHMQNYHI